MRHRLSKKQRHALLRGHRLSKKAQLRGIRKNIRVLSRGRGGPKWLLPSIRKFERKLAAEVRAEG